MFQQSIAALINVNSLLVYAVTAPIISQHPVSVRIAVNQTATFSVMASGGGLTYQWFGPGGVTLSDVAGEIAGARTSTLQILKAQQNNEGSYQVRVSSAGGSVVSESANLTISEEFICELRMSNQPQILRLVH